MLASALEELPLTGTAAALMVGAGLLAGTAPSADGQALVGNYDDTSQRLTGLNGEMPLPEPSPFVIVPGSDAMARRLDRARARLAEFVLPLMGRTPSSYPVEATSEGHVITFRAGGDREWRLEVDAVTHLPARIVGDVRWPHRLLTRVDGTITEEATVERYELNVKLADKIFRK